MARPRKQPMVLVEASVRGNTKLAGLPSDTARLGYFYVCLGDGKLQKPIPGQFASRRVFKEVAGRFGRFLESYIGAGLLEEGSALCTRCTQKWAAMAPEPGALVVHDWTDYQYDPWHAERQAAYEERRARRPARVSDAASDANLTRKPSGSDGDSRGRARPPGTNSNSNLELESLDQIPHSGSNEPHEVEVAEPVGAR